jgi:hypothetical protein
MKQAGFHQAGLFSFFIDSSGPERDRTADLLNAIQALSQLSYEPGFQSAPSPNKGF